jgi:hypothetical protein
MGQNVAGQLLAAHRAAAAERVHADPHVLLTVKIALQAKIDGDQHFGSASGSTTVEAIRISIVRFAGSFSEAPDRATLRQ